MTQLPDASNGLKLLTAKGGRGANGVFSTGGLDHLTTDPSRHEAPVTSKPYETLQPLAGRRHQVLPSLQVGGPPLPSARLRAASFAT